MRRKTFPALLRDAGRKGFDAGRRSLSAMLAILSVMGLVVTLYYLSPAAARIMDSFARWQHSGGVFAAALASSLAGGLLAETSLVYFQDRGRWTRAHLDNVVFRMGLFFISGAVVFEFYERQGAWFGHGTGWSTLVPKILVDQFIFTPIWSIPTQTTASRWHALHYSFPELRRELNLNFVTERMLPVLVTNWMFWLPGVTFVYAMPQNLQMPLCILANAIWGLLLSATARQPSELPTGTTADLVEEETSALPLAD